MRGSTRLATDAADPPAAGDPSGASSSSSSSSSSSTQPLRLKTYKAWTMAEALAFAKRDLGSDAVILHTRTFERGGFFGFGRKVVVEVTAARATDLTAPDARRLAGSSEPERSRATAVARAYGAVAASAGAGAARPTSSSNEPRPATLVEPRDPSRSEADERATRDLVRHVSGVEAHRLDMDAEREKTRRLAQAMLQRFDREAAVASQNERATEAALAEGGRRPSTLWPRVGEPRAGNAAPQSPTTVVESRPTPQAAGPAQRFVLVPEPVVPGVSVPGSSGAGTLAAASIRVGGADPDAPTPAEVAEVAAPVAPAAESARTASGPTELDVIATFVGAVLGRDAHAASTHAVRTATEWVRAPALEEACARLVEQEVARELAERIVRDVERELSSSVAAGSEGPARELVRELVERRIAAILPADDADVYRILPGRHGARRIAFIGPTGVGKTTTLAKFAAQLRLKRGLAVGVVAADTYRIAAVEQLRTYAEILDLPFEVAASPDDARQACRRLGHCDAILIDTAGRSQNDRMKLGELRAFLAAAEPDETHLVLSATAGSRALAREAQSFGALGVDRIALTKLDEAACFGPLVSIVEALGKQLSFLTHGQEVPEHIEPGRARRLAALVMGSEVR